MITLISGSSLEHMFTSLMIIRSLIPWPPEQLAQSLWTVSVIQKVTTIFWILRRVVECLVTSGMSCQCQQVHLLGLRDNMPLLTNHSLLFERRPGIPLADAELHTEALDFSILEMTVMMAIMSLLRTPLIYHSSTTTLCILFFLGRGVLYWRRHLRQLCQCQFRYLWRYLCQFSYFWRQISKWSS